MTTRVQFTAGVIALAVGLLAGAACSRGDRSPAPTYRPTAPAGAVALDGEILFNATQLIAENRGDQTWREVQIEVFRPGSASPYRYRADAILGHRSLTVGALHFTAPDGTRLSPFAGAPTGYAVTAILPDGSTGFVTGPLREVAPQ